MELPDYVTTYLQLGLFGAGVVAFIEKLSPVGPSFIILVFLGMTAATTGTEAGLLVLVTAFASMAGALFWYGLGRAIGEDRLGEVVEKYGKYILLHEPLFRRMTAGYRDSQFWYTFLAHTLPTVRIYVGLPAGMLRLGVPTFLLAGVLGTLCWNTPLIAAGYLLRGTTGDPVTAGLLVVAGVMLVQFSLMWVRRRLKKSGYMSTTSTIAGEGDPAVNR